MEVRLYIFGYPRIEMDGKQVEVDTRKAVALLAYLALNPARHARDVLAGLFWPDYDQPGARAALRRTLSVLNKATGECCLDITREQVGIAAGAPLWVDVLAFLDRLRDCESLDGQAQVQKLRQAVQLAGSRFMAGFTLRDAPEFDDWQFFQSENLSRLLAGALEKLARACSAAGDLEQAILYARSWLSQDALLEDAHRLLMDLYAQSGQRSAALRQYRECVRVLDQELSVAPLPETTALYQSILENRYQPAPVQRQPDQPAAPPAETPSPRKKYPLTGRVSEMQSLIQAYSAAANLEQWVMLDGEAGIGKTRLAEELLDHVRALGGQTLVLRCYEGETGLAYGPFVSALAAMAADRHTAARLAPLPLQALAEVARLAPEIGALFPDLPGAAVIEGPGAQSRFFESLRQVIFAALSGQSPGLLLVDDLQWADAASLDLLAYLLRRLPGSGLLVLSTLRSDLADDNPRLTQMIHDLQRSGRFQRISLARLSAAATSHLAQSAAGRSALPVDFAERLFQETEGLPFFVVEYLGAAMDEGLPPGEDWHLLASVRDVLQHRITGLDETARQLLSAAAVMGRSFHLSTLREVSGRSEIETITGLESLLARGVIVERNGSGEGSEIAYDFTHAKLRELVYAEVSLGRRRLLHRRAAETLLAESSRRDTGAITAMVAQHYLQAGQNDLAASYFRQAADRARGLYANRDALALYQAAIASGHPDLAGLHEASGDLHTLLGAFRAAIHAYEAAAALCAGESAEQNDCLASLERKLGQVHARLGQWDLAESHYRAALEAPGGDPAGVLADWSNVASLRGNLEEAGQLARRALQLAEAGNDSIALAGAYNIAGILARRQGDAARAAAYLERGLQIAREQGSDNMRIAAQNNLARVYAEMDRLDDAVALLREALAACRRLGDRHREAALLNHLADLLHLSGQVDEAMQRLKEAVVIFAEIGGEAGTEYVEIWKLAEW